MKTTSALVIGVTALLHQFGAYISVQAATCADYTGTACAAPKVDAATTTVCASTTCTTAECCVDRKTMSPRVLKLESRSEPSRSWCDIVRSFAPLRRRTLHRPATFEPPSCVGNHSGQNRFPYSG